MASARRATTATCPTRRRNRHVEPPWPVHSSRRQRRRGRISRTAQNSRPDHRPDKLDSRLSAIQDQPGVLLIADEWAPPSGVIAVHWHSVLTTDQKVGWISTLLVEPDRRRNGVARLLLKAASQAARSAGCSELVLHAPITSRICAHSVSPRVLRKAARFSPRPPQARMMRQSTNPLPRDWVILPRFSGHPC
jgi:GNAT superfamily N-acetyltransferase